MSESCLSSIPKTLEELEEAIQCYRTTDLTDLTGSELLRLWQNIRDLSLQANNTDQPSDGVLAEDSY